jgi:epsilon-lactone hydrolase
MRAHPPDIDPDRMSDKSQATGGREPQRYEIRVRGPIGPTIMQAFPTLAASRAGQDTLLTGLLRDQSALYGVIHQLEALGLQLLEIRPLRTSDPEH